MDEVLIFGFLQRLEWVFLHGLKVEKHPLNRAVLHFNLNKKIQGSNRPVDANHLLRDDHAALWYFRPDLISNLLDVRFMFSLRIKQGIRDLRVELAADLGVGLPHCLDFLGVFPEVDGPFPDVLIFRLWMSHSSRHSILVECKHWMIPLQFGDGWLNLSILVVGVSLLVEKNVLLRLSLVERVIARRSACHTFRSDITCGVGGGGLVSRRAGGLTPFAQVGSVVGHRTLVGGPVRFNVRVEQRIRQQCQRLLGGEVLLYGLSVLVGRTQHRARAGLAVDVDRMQRAARHLDPLVVDLWVVLAGLEGTVGARVDSHCFECPRRVAHNLIFCLSLGL